MYCGLWTRELSKNLRKACSRPMPISCLHLRAHRFSCMVMNDDLKTTPCIMEDHAQ